MLCQVVICNIYSKINIRPLYVEQQSKKLLLIIYNAIWLYMSTYYIQQKLSIKCSFTKLFVVLLKYDTPAVILQVVLDLYTRQNVAASWNECISKPVSVTKYVKRGGFLYPILF